MKDSTKSDLHLILSCSLRKVLASLQLPMLEIIWEQIDFRKHRGPPNTEDPVKCQSSVENTQERQQSAPEMRHRGAIKLQHIFGSEVL